MTTAETVLLPPDPSVFRSAFIYAGQGDATLLIVPDGVGGRKFVLVDINDGTPQGGTDVIAVLKDLLPRVDGKPVLDVFVNTHPHRDHLCGLGRLRQDVVVREVWHTGFTPSDRHAEAFKELTALIRDVQDSGGVAIEYRGTRETKALGAVNYNVLSPADHTKEEIDALKGDERDVRIHDYCGVLRFSYGTNPRFVLLTGDADKTAWKEYILGPTEYHAERVASTVLSAAHHGSRSFFKDAEDDEDVYVRHLELMQPTWVVVSSPKHRDSPHGHPHDDAIALYEQYVSGRDRRNVRVLGEDRECVIYDVYLDGRHVLDGDGGELVDAYPLDKNGDGGDGGGGGSRANAGPAVITTRIDSGRPMGRH
jgi:competence protein ComEC